VVETKRSSPFAETVISLANAPADTRQRQFVFILIILLLVVFAATVPFLHVQLNEFNVVVPLVATVMSINDLITSVLLYAQCSIYPSRSFLALASGYLFTALIIVPHGLTFPGAFTATGLIGAGPQTSPWLFFSAHFGLPIALLCYTQLRSPGDELALQPAPGRSAIKLSVAIVIFIAGALTLLCTVGQKYLPPILADRTHTIPSHLIMINGSIITLTAVALLALWVRRRTMLDHWLMLVCVALILEEACFSIGVTRFSLGFYAGRVFWLITSIVVLLLLLVETTRLYARLAHSYGLLEHEQNNKLLNARAITASIAHEVRQPLTAIAASSGAALRYLDKPSPDHEKIRQSLLKIISESHRTNDVFDSIRSLFGRSDQQTEMVDVNNIVRDVLRSVDRELIESAVVTVLELSDLPLISAHRNQLQQVVFNLVYNAIEAMQTVSGRKRTLSIMTECRSGSAIAIVVDDSGSGIAAPQIDSIFNAFVTTKRNGMGLGLAICRQIVEHHSGHLAASSDGNSGARFQVVLPIRSGG
jgi:signal transduction histidine kinase